MKQKLIYRVKVHVRYRDICIDCDSAGYMDNAVRTFAKTWFEDDGEKVAPEISVDVILVDEESANGESNG